MRRTTEIIAVNKAAYRFLYDESRKQRGCKKLSNNDFNEFWDRMRKDSEGLRELDDYSLGGGNGTHYYGKWTRWTVKDLRTLLSNAGFTWQERGTRDVTAY